MTILTLVTDMPGRPEVFVQTGMEIVIAIGMMRFNLTREEAASLAADLLDAVDQGAGVAA